MASLLGRQFRTAEGESLFIGDVAVRQSHSQGGEVTRHPVQDGGSISDHVICEPKRLSLEMAVSNNPICSTNPEDPEIGFASSGQRIENAYNQLLRIKKLKRVFDVQTKLHLYRNMVIESIDASQDAQTCEILRFQVNLAEVPVVGFETIGIERAANENLRGPTNRGDIAFNREEFCRTFISDTDFCLDCEDIDDFDEREVCLTGSFGVIAPEVIPPEDFPGFGVLAP